MNIRARQSDTQREIGFWYKVNRRRERVCGAGRKKYGIWRENRKEIETKEMHAKMESEKVNKSQ
jgi:hypothetical protein